MHPAKPKYATALVKPLTTPSVTYGIPWNLRQYLQRREGSVWTNRDTRYLLHRAKEIDDLVVRLLAELPPRTVN